jgi:hypothetical protein
MISGRAAALTVIAKVFNVLGLVYVTLPVRIAVAGFLALRRRWWHLAAFIAAVVVSEVLIGSLKGIYDRARPPGSLVATSGASFPSGHAVAASVTAVAAVIALVPAGRRRAWWGAAAVAFSILMGLSRAYLGAHWLSDATAGILLGTSCESFPVIYGGPHGAHLDLGGARGEAIKRTLKDQMGIEVSGVEPFGLAGSGGSSPMRLLRAGQPGGYLFGKLYARSHVRADRWYKLGRQLMYGRLEDEQSFKGVRRLVQQEDYALRLCRDAGLPSPQPYGFVELTPDREYLLLTEFFAGSTELGDAEVDDAVIDDGLLIVRRM